MRRRSVYRCLIRLHPRRFREQFEEEMLSVFDEAVRERRAVSLLADACVSLVRQWALRPRNWGEERRLRRPVPTSGPAVSLEDLDRRSAAIERRAWRVNQAWALAALAVHVGLAVRLDPTPYGIGLEIAVALGLGFWVTRRFRRGLAGPAEELRAVTIARDFRRTALQRRRDSLWKWSATMGNILVLWMLIPSSLMLGQPQNGFSLLLLLLSGSLGAAFLIPLKRMNRRAIQELQARIDALAAANRRP